MSKLIAFRLEENEYILLEKIALSQQIKASELVRNMVREQMLEQGKVETPIDEINDKFDQIIIRLENYDTKFSHVLDWAARLYRAAVYGRTLTARMLVHLIAGEKIETAVMDSIDDLDRNVDAGIKGNF